VNICLTKRLVYILYQNDVSLSYSRKNDSNQYNSLNEIALLLKEDVLKQCWFRFLHIIGNPIELCFPEIIYNFEGGYSHSDLSSNRILPFIFHKAIKGLCTL